MIKKETRNENGELHSFNDEPAVVSYCDYNPKSWSYKVWYQNGLEHRVNGPAFENRIGDRFWYQNGERHRSDGPAKEYKDGTKCWYQNGKRHRVDGPAVEYPDGYKEWYQNGQLHRLDGPAVEFSNGDKRWYQNGLKHRVGGPAIEWPNGEKEYWIEGEQLTEQEFLAKTKKKSTEKYLQIKKNMTLEEIIDDELVTCHIGTYESFDSPYDAVVALMMFHQDLGAYFGKSQSEKVDES